MLQLAVDSDPAEREQTDEPDLLADLDPSYAVSAAPEGDRAIRLEAA
jgi:hypothetical protein